MTIIKWTILNPFIITKIMYTIFPLMFIFLFLSSTFARIRHLVCGTQLLVNMAFLLKDSTIFLKPHTRWKLFTQAGVYRGALCAYTHDGHRDNGFIAINVAHRRPILRSRGFGSGSRGGIDRQAHTEEDNVHDLSITCAGDPNFLISSIRPYTRAFKPQVLSIPKTTHRSTQRNILATDKVESISANRNNHEDIRQLAVASTRCFSS